MSDQQQRPATIESETKSFEIKFIITEKPFDPPKRFEPMGVIHESGVGSRHVVVSGDSNDFSWLSFVGGLCLGIGLGSLFASIL